MAGKPRVQAPKQRADTTDGGTGRRAAIVGGVATLAGLILIGVLFSTMGGGGGVIDAEAVRADLEAVGCTLEAKAPAPPGAAGYHTLLEPGATSPDWNTDPPAAGAHYGVAAVFGIYDDELEIARVVHNLEHGGIYILYGADVPAATVEELEAFYNDHKTGTIMAPRPELGNRIALGSWVVRDEEFDDQDPLLGTGYLAKCGEFDEGAFTSYFHSFQFRGPERFDPGALQPGH